MDLPTLTELTLAFDVRSFAFTSVGFYIARWFYGKSVQYFMKLDSLTEDAKEKLSQSFTPSHKRSVTSSSLNFLSLNRSSEVPFETPQARALFQQYYPFIWQRRLYIVLIVILLWSVNSSIEGASTQNRDFIVFLTMLVIGLSALQFIAYRRRIRGLPARRLLLLRTFHVQTKGYARSLVRYFFPIWSSIGSSRTFIDPSLAREEYQGWFPNWRMVIALLVVGTISELFAFLICFSIIEQEPVRIAQSANYFLLAWILSGIATIGYLFVSTYRNFIRERMVWLSKLSTGVSRTPSLFGRYGSARYYLSGQIWKEALSGVVTQSDLVIFDLRGFSAKNYGCKYEIEYLLKNHPLNRLLLWTDGSTDMLFLKQLIRKLWVQTGKSESKNVEDSQIILYRGDSYVSSGMPNLTRLLCNMATRNNRKPS